MTLINKLIYLSCVLCLIFVVTLVMACTAPYASQEQQILIIICLVAGALYTLLIPVIIWMDVRKMRRARCPNCGSIKQEPWLCGICGWTARAKDLRYVQTNEHDAYRDRVLYPKP